jgi:hypothetical protein
MKKITRDRKDKTEADEKNDHHQFADSQIIQKSRICHCIAVSTVFTFQASIVNRNVSGKLNSGLNL